MKQKHKHALTHKKKNHIRFFIFRHELCGKRFHYSLKHQLLICPCGDCWETKLQIARDTFVKRVKK